MKGHTNKRLLFFLATIALLTGSQSALAYLDPATGSFILQMLVAGFLGAMLYIKLAWANIKVYLQGLFKAQKSIETEEDEDDRSETEKP